MCGNFNLQLFSWKHNFFLNAQRVKGTYIFKDDNGNVLSKETFDVKHIKENSAAKIIPIKKDVLKNVKKYFYVTLELKDKKGKVVSTNEYMLLIGDQEKAGAQFKQMGEEVRKRNRKYTYGNYYKFYDKYSGDNKEELESKTDTITTRGF